MDNARRARVDSQGAARLAGVVQERIVGYRRMAKSDVAAAERALRQLERLG